MPQTASAANRVLPLTPTLAAMLQRGVKTNGSYDPWKVIPFIEESLTLEEAGQAEAFLAWVQQGKRTFGHNIDSVYAQFAKEHGGLAPAKAGVNTVAGVLSMHLQRMVLMAVQQAGSYDPEEALPVIEEQLTLADAQALQAFLAWVHANGKAFGPGNIAQRCAEFAGEMKKA